MTVASLALPVVAAAMFLGTGWLAAGLVLSAWLKLAAVRPVLARHAPLVSALPWLAAAAVALAAVVPGDPHMGSMFACHCLESMPAWVHPCPVHPEEAAMLVLPALIVLVALLPGRLRALMDLASEPVGHGGGDQPRVVSLGTPMALLHGWLRPTLVVDQDLWAALSEAERAAVLAHERGHLRRRDPLVRMVLRGALMLAPRSLARQVVRGWLDHAELAADAEAARRLADPTLVAQTLLRCARLGARPPGLALAWTGGRLERRVRALVQGQPSATPAHPDVGWRELGVLTGLASLALAATPWVHHQVEHLLNLAL